MTHSSLSVVVLQHTNEQIKFPQQTSPCRTPLLDTNSQFLHIKELEDIKDLSDQLKYKEKRRDQAATSISFSRSVRITFSVRPPQSSLELEGPESDLLALNSERTCKYHKVSSTWLRKLEDYSSKCH